MYNQYLIRDTDGGQNCATLHLTGRVIHVTHNNNIEVFQLNIIDVDPDQPQPGFYKYDYAEKNGLPIVTLSDKGEAILTIEQPEPELLTIRHGDEAVHLTDQQLIDLVHIIDEFIYAGRLSEVSPVPKTAQ